MGTWLDTTDTGANVEKWVVEIDVLLGVWVLVLKEINEDLCGGFSIDDRMGIRRPGFEDVGVGFWVLVLMVFGVVRGSWVRRGC